MFVFREDLSLTYQQTFVEYLFCGRQFNKFSANLTKKMWGKYCWSLQKYGDDDGEACFFLEIYWGSEVVAHHYNFIL